MDDTMLDGMDGVSTYDFNSSEEAADQSMGCGYFWNDSTKDLVSIAW